MVALRPLPVIARSSDLPSRASQNFEVHDAGVVMCNSAGMPAQDRLIRGLEREAPGKLVSID